MNAHAAPRTIPLTITSVKDSRGYDVPDGLSTTDRNLIVSGTAAPHEVVEIFHGGDPKAKARVDGFGNWRKELYELAIGARGFQAVGRYAGKPKSNVYWVDIAIPAIPRLAVDRVVDSVGQVIPDGGETDDRNLSLSGIGEPGETIELFHGDTPLGDVVVERDGSWRAAFEGLLPGVRPFLARGRGYRQSLYRVQISFPNVPPVAIMRVVDSTGREIRNGGETADRNLSVMGTGRRGDTVELFHGSTRLDDVVVDQNGAWHAELNGLTPGVQGFLARDAYGRESLHWVHIRFPFPPHRHGAAAGSKTHL